MHLDANGPEQVEQLRSIITAHRPDKVTADLNLPAERDVLMAIARSGLWPAAVHPSLIIGRDEEAKRIRAATVLADFVRLLPGKRFLDYGCGEGHMAVEATRRGCTALGYDPTPQAWDRLPAGQINLTDELKIVQDTGPYDIALCYDVLDHAGDQQVEILKNIRRTMKPSGYIYLRCHPYTSIHGTHLYTSLNLAYIHLLLKPEDITELGGKPEQVTKVVKPLNTYQGWIKQAGLTVNREIIRRVEPPRMFHDLAIVGKIITELYGTDDPYIKDVEKLHSILSMEFVDYDLSVA